MAEVLNGDSSTFNPSTSSDNEEIDDMDAETKIDVNLIPRIEKHFRLQWEEAQNAFVILYPEGMVKLNESAGEILSRCDGNKSIQNIITALTEKFPDVNNEDIRQDIMAFIADAVAQHWLTYE